MAIDPASRSASSIRDWWNNHSSLTSLLACSQVIWPQFVELHQCVFWLPPFEGREELIEYMSTYGPSDWAIRPLEERRALAAQMGEQPLNHLARVHSADENELDADLVQELFDIMCESWPPALAKQFPGRKFAIAAVDREDGLTIRLTEA